MVIFIIISRFIVCILAFVAVLVARRGPWS
jgi:hypothetical protein